MTNRPKPPLEVDPTSSETRHSTPTPRPTLAAMNLDDPRAKTVLASWRAPITAWAQWMTAAGRRAETIRTRTDHLRRLSRALPGSPWEVTTAQLVEWSAAQSWAHETRRSVHNSLRSFYDWATRAGHVASSPAEELPVIAPPPPSPRPCPAPVLEEARADADPRLLLMIRLASELGLRRAEIAQVHERDLVPDLLGWTLVTHGKGGKERVVPLAEDLAQAIRLACRAGGGWAFPGRVDGHLSAQYVGKLLSRALASGWTGHTLRHRFGSVTYAATGDLMSVSRLMGHSSVATTQRYVATDAATLRRVAATASTRLAYAA